MSTASQYADYVTALDLKRDPFSPEPDSLFYYSFDSIEQRLKILDGLVKGSDLFVLVIGDAGCGKTTMLNRYLASIDSEWTSARIQVESEVPGTEPSGQPPADGYPVYVLKNSADPIVMVDDAHRLPEKELKFLVREALVPGSQYKIKRLVLFGESQLHTAVTNLAASLSAQPPVNKIYLPGLTVEQTADFLRHRLVIAGYSGDSPFDANAAKMIHQNAGGLPGRIIDFARQWLMDQYTNKQEGQHMVPKGSPGSRRTIVWIGGGVIALLLAAFWFFSDRDSLSSRTVKQRPQKTVFREKIAQRPPMDDRPAASQPRLTTPPATSPQPTAGDQASEAETAGSVPVEPAGSGDSAEMQPEPAQAEKSPAPATVVARTDPKTAPVESLESAPSPKEAAPRRTAQPVLKPEPPKPEPSGTGAGVRNVRREKWLLAQDGAFYTIQIIGVSSEKSLLDFIDRNRLLKQSEIAYYKSRFRGKPWFQALYGLYPSGREARLAADKLPENIRRAGPWVRKLSDVQSAIGERASN